MSDNNTIRFLKTQIQRNKLLKECKIAQQFISICSNNTQGQIWADLMSIKERLKDVTDEIDGEIEKSIESQSDFPVEKK